MKRLGVLALLACLFATTVPGLPARGASSKASSKEGGAQDAVVVAVIDFNFVPYHWDFLASKMPQHTDSNAGNDLPLDRAPHEWLPGFPEPNKAFASYNRFDLSLEEKDPNAMIAGLDARDQAQWVKVKGSDSKKVNYYWFPGTKVIGGIEFGNNKLHGTSSDHGAGVTSVSVGNIHGACPECLLVFINLDNGNEASAIKWAMKQPWIDVITNSYGRGNVVPKVYHGPDVPDQKKASERGQTVFFSAGNGYENAFTLANNTYMSSEKGPDWLITVGAVSPFKDTEDQETSGSHASYIGAGKPVDVAGLGNNYPSAYTAVRVSETGPSGFSGTSNAAPTIAGTYARALYFAREAMRGPSRAQDNGVIAKGAFDCASKRSDCELGDGRLTAAELRSRLLLGAIHTVAGMTGLVPTASTPPVGEEEFLNEGHGTYFVRELRDDKAWFKEFFRIIGPLLGEAKPIKRPDGEREWMIVDSFCRQHIWGEWNGGYYLDGKTELPGPDPLWPVRSSLEASCPAMQAPP